MVDIKTQDVDVISRKTGEVVTDNYSALVTVTEMEKTEKQKAEKDKRTYIKLCRNERGYFTMTKYEIGRCLDLGVSISNVARVMYLSTYMGYNNELKDDGNYPITKKKMRELLNVTYPTFSNFYDECIANNIFYFDNGVFYMNREIFKRGKLSPDEKAAQNTMFLYFKGIRDLYKSVKASEHKTLAYLFLMMPYANRKYNVLCHNPEEQVAENVECLTWDEICNLFDITGKTDLRKRISSLRVGGQKAIVWIGKGKAAFSSCCFFINPNIYYTGYDWGVVEVLTLCCDNGKGRGLPQKNVV